MPFCIEIGSIVTDGRTDEGTRREHYASGQSRLAYRPMFADGNWGRPLGLLPGVMHMHF